MTPKQRIILFFIDTKFADDQNKLVKYLDRSAFFPSELEENLKCLLVNQFITVSGYLNNGTDFKYSVTEKGKEYLIENFDKRELDEYAGSFSSPEFMKEIVAALLRNKSGT